MKATIVQYRIEFEEEWKLVYEMLKQHEKYFPGACDIEQQTYMYDLFTRAYCSVVTRCFGWGIPCTTMIPFADFINHHNVDSSYEFISRLVNPKSEE